MTETATRVIEAQGLMKSFGSLDALRGCDLEVTAGECVGLLGPNGAGKSTFIGCLYGTVAPTGGELRVFGLDPKREPRAVKARIGIVPQENALDEELTVLENMRLYARFVGLPRGMATERIEQLLAHMALDHKRDAPIRSLSGGMKRRLAFVRALLVNPELLILDEPTTGLDPTVRHLIWERVLGYRQEGKTVLVTTHYMHEAELLCNRIVILDAGRVMAMGSPQELIQQYAPGFVGYFPAETEIRLRPNLPPGTATFEQGRQFCVRAPRFEDLTELQRVTNVSAVQLRPASLEDVYLKLTGHGLDENE
ncbi:MAG: ABC transporter ATP-binding protein [Verrucomicrobia bacterium]|nr:ABC transporter ATP-binding protein [Verrucomicrobiota bacterium]MBV9273780.1 ABC transporter ATP-binding protein [Verrucomicrobiota bacterium]